MLRDTSDVWDFYIQIEPRSTYTVLHTYCNVAILGDVCWSTSKATRVGVQAV